MFFKKEMKEFMGDHKIIVEQENYYNPVNIRIENKVGEELAIFRLTGDELEQFIKILEGNQRKNKKVRVKIYATKLEGLAKRLGKEKK